MYKNEFMKQALDKVIELIEKCPPSVEATTAQVIAADLALAMNRDIPDDQRRWARQRVQDALNVPRKGETVDFAYEHRSDDNGNPSGGRTCGIGFDIAWQDGPMKDADGNSLTQNGAFVQTLVEVVINRIEYYQSTKFACAPNAVAIAKFREGLDALDYRRKKREEQGIDGTHEVESADPVIRLAAADGEEGNVYRSEFEKLKATGMLYELYPSAPAEFPKVDYGARTMELTRRSDGTVKCLTFEDARQLGEKKLHELYVNVPRLLR